jgi:predicted Zn finger-like uncharacterized protein
MSENIVLSCPNCATQFSAPADKFIPNGRQVRCSNCQHTWFHAAPTTSGAASLKGGATISTRGATAASATATATTAAATTVATATSATTRPTIRDEIAERERRRGGGFFSWLLWALALFLLAAILTYIFREPLKRAVPSLAPTIERYTDRVDTTAQRLVGTGKPAPVLVPANIRYDLKGYDEGEEGEKAMLVEAQLKNTGDEDLPAPQLRVRIVDEDDEQLLGAMIGPEDMMATTIKAGETTRYFVRIPEPPADFDRVLVDLEK